MLCVMNRMHRFENLRSEISDLKSQFESTSRQIRAWADSLQNSQIKGQRHLNDTSRQQYEQSNRTSAFMKKQAEFKQQMEERLTRVARERANRQRQTDGD
jgi:Skp family chaperone for outer membrane proteins